MKRIALSLGPPMTMLAALAWLCGSHLSPPLRVEQAGPKLPSIKASRLNPVMPKQPSRNPFLPVEKEPEAPTEAEVAIQRALLAPVVVEPEFDLPAAAQLLELTGTIVSGQQRQAMINQHLFAEGEALVVRTGAGNPPLEMRVAKVQMNQVELQSEAGRVLLTYGAPAAAFPVQPARPQPRTLMGIPLPSLPKLPAEAAPKNPSPGGLLNPVNWLKGLASPSPDQARQVSDAQ